MKDRRKVIIQNKFLKRIRNNLRAFIKEWYSKVRKELFDKRSNIMKDYRINKEDRSKNRILKNLKDLKRKIDRLDKSLTKSIIECPRCHKIDKDMAYFADWDEWYCIDCFEKNYTAWKKEIERHYP
ncbi:MAG: hypothetical protein ACOC44_20165 [Promethearchaeia archaeon]